MIIEVLCLTGYVLVGLAVSANAFIFAPLLGWSALTVGVYWPITAALFFALAGIGKWPILLTLLIVLIAVVIFAATITAMSIVWEN